MLLCDCERCFRLTHETLTTRCARDGEAFMPEAIGKNDRRIAHANGVNAAVSLVRADKR